MKKLFSYAFALCTALAITASFSACGSDSDDTTKNTDTNDAANLDYSSKYAEQWANYMMVVAKLLENDATSLYSYWNDTDNGQYSNSYANIFKNHNSTYYSSAINCVEQIFDGCSDIASEVGSSKIGEPYSLYEAGKKTQALYAVESWYSWHSRDDYTNNIYSIRNSYYGSTNGTVNSNSLSAALAKVNRNLDDTAKLRINAAAEAIQAIPQPFRNHINSKEAKAAMEACGELEDFITNELKPYFVKNINDDETLDPIIEQYVDGVVLPTYKDLAAKNATLYNKVKAFKSSPSNSAFAACCEAWLDAREPWEQSEAFLFGPVADKGLDPNMDSWPLDQAGIVKILMSEDFTDLNWSGEYDENNETIAKAQSLRGFHTLEYLIFKDGEARTVN